MARTTTIRAWPFLVSTDATHGFVTILAPQFLVAAGVADVLRRVTEGDVTPNGAVNLLPVTGLPTGAVLIAYRIAVAPGALIDSPDEILYDRQGRRILLVEGLVVEALDAAELAVSEDDFAQVRQAYRTAFQRVWETNPELPPVAPSLAFALAGGAPLAPIRRTPIRFSTPPMRRDDSGPPTLPGAPNLLLLLVLLGAIFTFLALTVRLLRQGAL
jgi:hypothetical protein